MSNHRISFKKYVLVFTALLVLTFITVVVAQIDFGVFNVFFAGLVASIKAGLVLLYFMGLKYDNKIYWLIFGSSVFFLMVLYLFSKLDVLTRILENNTL